jgi:hypothetical protein
MITNRVIMVSNPWCTSGCWVTLSHHPCHLKMFYQTRRHPTSFDIWQINLQANNQWTKKNGPIIGFLFSGGHVRLIKCKGDSTSLLLPLIDEWVVTMCSLFWLNNVNPNSCIESAICFHWKFSSFDFSCWWPCKLKSRIVADANLPNFVARKY